MLAYILLLTSIQLAHCNAPCLLYFGSF